MIEEQKEKSKLEKVWNFLGTDGIWLSGRPIMMIILCAMAINYWLQFCLTYPFNNPILKPILLSITFLIPVSISVREMKKIFFDDKEHFKFDLGFAILILISMSAMHWGII